MVWNLNYRACTVLLPCTVGSMHVHTYVADMKVSPPNHIFYMPCTDYTQNGYTRLEVHGGVTYDTIPSYTQLISTKNSSISVGLL